MTDVVARATGDLAIGSDTPATVTVSHGGSAANVAAWAASLGVSTCLIARIGDDAFGRQAGEDLLAAGVDARLSVDPTLPTGTCVIVVTPDGERTMLPDAGANASWSLSDVPEQVIVGASHLHLVGYALLRAGARPAALHALAIAREHGVGVSIDPSSAAPLAEVGADAFLAWTAGADLCFPNLDEARVLTGLDDPVAAAQALTEAYAEVVVTLGADGAIWAGRGGSPVHRAAERVTVVDSTGAGDAFAAAYLAARLDGAEPAVCLERATARRRPRRAATGRPPRPRLSRERGSPRNFVQDHGEWEGPLPRDHARNSRTATERRPDRDHRLRASGWSDTGPWSTGIGQARVSTRAAVVRFGRGVRRSRPTPRPGGQRFDRHRGRQGAHASGALGCTCRPDGVDRCARRQPVGRGASPHGREVPADLRAAATEHARTRTERVASAARDGGRRVPARGARRGHRRSAVRPSRGVRSAGLPRWSSGLSIGHAR